MGGVLFGGAGGVGGLDATATGTGRPSSRHNNGNACTCRCVCVLSVFVFYPEDRSVGKLEQIGECEMK